jgi:hypothetical protein
MCTPLVDEMVNGKGKDLSHLPQIGDLLLKLLENEIGPRFYDLLEKTDYSSSQCMCSNIFRSYDI